MEPFHQRCTFSGDSMGFNRTILFILVSALLTGCTKNGDPASLLTNITDKIHDVFEPDDTVSIAKSQVLSIKDNLNNDTAYVFTEADLSELKKQGVVEANSELNGWVK